MALQNIELSLMAFPQRWDGPSGALTLNVLLMPVGDPTLPLGTGPKFAGTPVPLIVNFAAGLGALPTTSSTPSQTASFVATPPLAAATLFPGLQNQFFTQGITVNSGPKVTLTTAPSAQARILKSLPTSYTSAFAFNGPASRDVSVGDGYGCALRDQAPKQIQTPPLKDKPLPPDNSIYWGQILSYALRQPALAQAMGLFYATSISLPAAMVADGGFLWVTLDGSSPSNPWVADWKATPSKVASYAARIPTLTPGENRAVFASMLLPILGTSSSSLGDAQLDAEEYDDGFAQIVHGNQPQTVDAATLDPNQIAPGTDAGVQLGWDDEKLTIWFNNQLDILRASFDSSTDLQAPLGVHGYRVDVRDVTGPPTWNSLCVVNGSLPFNASQSYYYPPPTNGNGSTSISGDELWLSPAPVRPAATPTNETNDQPAWLPLYFAQWAGSSLVLPDPVVGLLAFGAQNANVNPPPSLPSTALPNPSADLSAVPVLRYGHTYEFRVRLVDLTGGGPPSTDSPIHPGPAPTTQVSFLRFIPPKALEVVATPPWTTFTANPATPPTPPDIDSRQITTLAVQRPRIGYPEAIFAGVDPSTFWLANVGALIQQAWSSRRAISVPDPDVDRFEVRVEAKVPVGDTGAAGVGVGDIDGVYRVIYSYEVPFPTSGADPTVTLTFDYVDGVDEIANLIAPPQGSTTVPIPTSRTVRVRLFPKCKAQAQSPYYGSDAAMVGPSSDYVVRQYAETEDAIFPNNPEVQLQAFYFQPGDTIPQLLAQQILLRQDGLAFAGEPGIRTLFGGSGTLRHSVSPDGGTFTFSNQTELLGHWIVVLSLDLGRDWTWAGFGLPALTFQRDGTEIGSVLLPAALPPSATGLPGQTPERSKTRIVFFDALDPQPKPSAFPRELNPAYIVSANFNAIPPQTPPSPQQYPFTITLPITTPPAQTPRIVSTGIAQSPYKHTPTYSQTSPRDRYLWVEFDREIADAADDAYFGRVLAYGPDPLLAAKLLPKTDVAAMLADSTEPSLPIDPEPIRRIFAGQSSDQAGLDAMTQMTPANLVGVGKSRQFCLLPLPPALTSDDLRLFGFWTYEFRVGHAKMWSTAQGRFGRPLRVSGLQHPPPHLICSLQRNKEKIDVSAPFAVTVYNGDRLYDLQAGDPQTRIWFMLYAQVLQADGASYRNVLLDRRQGQMQPQSKNQTSANNPQHGVNLGPIASTDFAQKDVEARLALIRLSLTAALSILAVEVLPGPVSISDFADLARPPAATPTAPAAEIIEDPLGLGLGTRRILRTSPLTAVPAIC
jgi:hypothetical protein